MIKTSYLSGVCLMAVSAMANSEILVGYDFDAIASDYRDATVQSANVIVSQLTSPMDISLYGAGGDNSGLDASGQTLGSAGSLGAVAIQIYDATTSSFADAIEGNDYLTFTVSPGDQHQLHLSSLTFKVSKQSAISVDEYAVTDSAGNLIGSTAAITNVLGLSGTLDGVSIDLSDSQFQNLTEATTFRIYAWGRGAASGSSSLAMLDKVVLNGTAEPARLVAYDFDADAPDPSVPTLADASLSASALESPMAISFDSGNGDNTGLDASGFELGSSATLGAVGIQVTDAVRQTFELAKESDNYMAFTITPDAGKGAHLTGISFKAIKQNGDSVDEYAVTDADGNLIGSTVAIETIDGLVASYDGVTIDLEHSDLEYITEATEIRIYVWGRGSKRTSGSLAGFDKVTLYGSAFDVGNDYYVDETGNDSNSGSANQPFASVQHAVNQAGIGSTIYIGGGSYHETVDLSGVIGVTLRPNGNEQVTFNGTQAITTNWTLEDTDSIVLPDGNDTPSENLPGRGMVYVTTLDDSIDDVTQLFVDDKIMTLARFPNALVWSDDFWEQRTQKQSGSSRGYIVGTDAIAEAGVSFKGCMMLHNFENYGSHVSHVTSHTAGNNIFEYNSIGGWRHSSAYFFEGGKGNAERVLLDMAQEWAYDENTRQLYLWADDGQNPTGRTIAGKVQTFAIIGDATTKNITLDGLNFFATTWSFTSSDGITIQNCNNEYPSCSDRAKGVGGQPKTAYIQGSKTDFCENVTLYNNIFRRADGAGLMTAYTGNMLVENNLFEQINYTCVAGKAVQLAGSRNLVARHNTLRDSGTSAGFSIGRWYMDPTGINPYVFENNVAEGCSRMQIDGTAFYAVGGNAQESITRYNWGYNNRQRDFRWDGNNTPLIGIYCNIYRNVCMNSVNKTSNLIGGAYKLKGDFHEIYNNIAIDVDGRVKGQFEISIGAGGNANSESFNNAGDYLSGNNTDGDIPGVTGNNYLAQRASRDMSLLLRDPYGFDFRPRWDAVELIDQAKEVSCTYYNGEQVVDVTAGYTGNAPDIGAYEFGDDNYIIPGYRTPQASTPIPADGNSHALYDCDLMWLGGLNAVSYNIYLGTTANGLSFQGNQTNNIFNPGGWTNDQTYFWRIDSVLEDGSVVTGDVWTFTINDHTPRAFSSRQAVDEDQSVSFELSGHDPDGNALTYTVSSNPVNGTITGTAPHLVYTPNANFHGTDSILYTVNNGSSNSTNAIVIFEVADDNADAPSFTATSFTESAAVIGSVYSGSIAAAATDVDEQALSYSIVSGPAWLELATDGALSGSPALADFGINTWVVRATDPTGLSATATLKIKVIEDAIAVLGFEGFGTDIAANPLTIGGNADNLTVVGVEDGNDYLYSVVYSNVDVDGDSQNDTLTFDLRVKGWTGSTTDAALDTDGSTDAASAMIGTTVANVVLSSEKFTIGDSKMANGQSLEFLLENLSVNLTNPAIYGSAASAGFTSALLKQTSTTGNSHQAIFGEGTGLLGIQFATNVNSGQLDVGRGSLYISSDAGNGTRSTSWGVANVDFTIEIETAAYGSYTEWAANYGLNDALASADSDGDGISNLEEYQNGTNPLVNVAPVADPISLTVDEDDSVSITLSGSDQEGNSLSYQVITPPANGTLSGSAPNLSYMPEADYYGSDSFSYIANDGSSQSSVATVSITILPINDLPNVGSSAIVAAALVNAPFTGTLADAVSDPDGDSLSFAVLSGPSWLNIAANGSLSGTASLEDKGLNTWLVQVDDGNGGSSTIDLEITVELPILVGYDFDEGDPASPTLVSEHLTASVMTSPMPISYDSSFGDNSGVSASGLEFGSAETLGALAIQVIDATTSSFANALAGDDYIAFTVTPALGTGLQLSSLSFKATKKHIHSVDEYAVTDAAGNILGSPASITNVLGLTTSYDGVTVDLAGSDLEFITAPTELRIYAWGRGTSNASNTLAAIDKVTLHGSNYLAPVAYWELDDASTSIGQDSSGNGFDGTIANATSVTGKVGSALDFNGSDADVTLPASVFASIDQEITISLWAYGATDQARSDTIFSAKDASGNRVLNIHLPWGNSNVYWDAGWNAGYDRIFKAATADQFKGSWSHWVFVKNATTGSMAIYHNGTLFHSGIGTTKSMAGITAATLGSELGVSNYAGAIDEVIIYDSALSAEEIAELYTSYE
ncbi:Ig-like domain-containing protein [Rubritalea spongiae]|uniref:Ig-like domain-containing protein n=1 Tax=Rubritalea spongiae TaxID=430797 RepID=A0ABW5E6P0_9BACT